MAKTIRPVPGLTRSWAQTGEKTWDVVSKANGKIASKAQGVISDDGNTLTTTSTGTTESGQPFKNTFVMERVSGGPGLAGTWKRIRAQFNRPDMLVIEASSPDAISFEYPESKDRYSGKLDGSPNPISGPRVPTGATACFKKVNARTIELRRNLNDKAFNVSRFELSEDGRTLTETTWTVGHEGEKITEVLERQP